MLFRSPGYTARDTVDMIHEQGGIAIAPHPYADGGFIFKGLKGVGPLIHKINFDGVEAINANITEYFHNHKAQNILKVRRLAAIGSSDAHFSGGFMAYTEFPGSTPEELMIAIKHRKTIARGRVYNPLEAITVVRDYAQMDPAYRMKLGSSGNLPYKVIDKIVRIYGAVLKTPDPIAGLVLNKLLDLGYLK